MATGTTRTTDDAVAERNSLAAAKTAAAHDYTHYRKLLAEAEAVRGISLWQDAWRRLRGNRVAMASLAFLMVLTLVALLTPALPLQSPTVQNVRKNQFKAPNTWPVKLELENSEKQKESLTQLMAGYRSELARLAAELELARAGSDHKAVAAAEKAFAAKQAAHPYKQFWNKPGWLTMRMIDLRLALWGDWAIPSLFGTDALGRDLLARVLWGARVSLMVGITAALVSLVIGVSYGATAGYVGGWIDALMMRIVDTLYAIPFLFVVIFLITILSEESRKAWLESYGVNRMLIFYIVIGLFYWFTMARVVRGQVISLKHEQFVDAARTIGAGSGRIIFRHLVPNVLGVVIIYLTLTIPSVMLFEAILSFLGLGVEPPDVSWGLLADQGVRVISPIRTYWWLVLFPSAALALTLFALNFLGDGLRDALDPRLKNR